VGRHNITAPETSDTPYSASYKISHAVVHAQFNSSTNKNDIAMVRSASYIRYGRGVGPACLAFGYVGYPVPSGTVLTAIGFGSTEYAISSNFDTTSWILQKVPLTVNNTLGVCATDKTRLCLFGAFNSSNALTGDTCQRDSG
jgi:Trypsin